MYKQTNNIYSKVKIIKLLIIVIIISGCKSKDKSNMNEDAVKKEIWQTVQDMNRLWTKENRANELVYYFHERMTAITPSDLFRIEGQKACVAGWEKFTAMAKIIRWEETDPKIELFGNNNFAVVTYNFSMTFIVGNDTIETSGRDMFSLVKENNTWWVVSDQFSSFPVK